jgi:hypothetical protein
MAWRPTPQPGKPMGEATGDCRLFLFLSPSQSSPLGSHRTCALGARTAILSSEGVVGKRCAKHWMEGLIGQSSGGIKRFVGWAEAPLRMRPEPGRRWLQSHDGAQ